MNLLRTNRTTKDKASIYATRTDFCEVFCKEMNSLYLLSFLLTADRAKAEQCFIASLEDCVIGNPVFKAWARSRARRTTIQNALRMIAPCPAHPKATPAPVNPPVTKLTLETEAAIERVLAFGDFERFVFVISILERYTDQDCSVLLNCSRQNIRETRLRALQLVGESCRTHFADRETALTVGQRALAVHEPGPGAVGQTRMRGTL